MTSKGTALADQACEDSEHSWEVVSTGTIIVETLTRCASCGYAPYPPERSWLPEFAALAVDDERPAVAGPAREDGDTT